MIPNSKSLHFFDLDGTLWDIDCKSWIIDKEEPHKPIIRLDKFEESKILSGLYIKDNLKIEYNGETYFISNNLFNEINKKKKIPIERLGISWIEFYDEKYINNTKVTFLFNNIYHLRNKNEYICLLSGRAHRERYGDILNTLRKKLQDIGIEIYKIYFVADKFYYRHDETISLNKLYILIEHLVGLKIDDGKFKAYKQDWFNNVYFYDDEKMNIDYANDVQMIFDRVLKNTDDDLFKMVIDRVNKNEINLTTNLITNNEINPFKTKKIQLKAPLKYPIKVNERIKNFNGFINESGISTRKEE
ncbi:MAG: hypothetical protein HPY57_15020 [Ignavibacteria bacterium]|nr:hypothetical protein [Ignavibacteria bacterium]